MTELSRFAALAVPYSTAICLAYLFGYWGPFGVNVLEYAGFSDIIRLSLSPMLLIFVIIAIMAAVFHTDPPKWIPESNEKPLSFSSTSTWILIAFQAITVAWAFWKGAEPSQWFVLGTALSFFPYRLVTRSCSAK